MNKLKEAVLLFIAFLFVTVDYAIIICGVFYDVARKTIRRVCME